MEIDILKEKKPPLFKQISLTSTSTERQKNEYAENDGSGTKL